MAVLVALLGRGCGLRAVVRRPGVVRCGSSSSPTAAASEAFPRTKAGIPHGVCAVYKPPGWSSANVVAKVRGVLERAIKIPGQKKFKVKVGHGGTLDPLARGVLVIGVGHGCKEMQGYLKGSKRYRAVALLGDETDTLDSEGAVVDSKPWDHVTRDRLEAALPHFTGDIRQVPPMFSALRKNGTRLYDLARKGIEVERESRPVTISGLALDDAGVGDSPGPLALPKFGLDVECSGGTYIRTLISDLAKHDAVDALAHMVELERTKQGPFELGDCLHEDRWDFDAICQHLLDSAPVAQRERGLPPPDDAPEDGG